MKKVFSFFKNAGVVAKAPPTSGAKASPTSGPIVPPTSGAKASPTNGAKVPPTSQGRSGMEARRPNFRDDDMNAIHLAARDGSEWRVKQILSFRKNDLNSRDKKRRTALHVACAYGRSRMVKLLIERRCLLDLRDSEKKTALIQALQYQNVKCATILLDYSADPNAMDNDGNTALHYAVLGHNKAIVEKLLVRKANTELRNKRDLTPLALAKLAKNDEMVELLERSPAKDDPRKWKPPLIYEYKEERRPETFQSSNLAFIPKATNLQESTKSAQTKTKSKTVDEIAAEGSLNRKQQLTSEYKEEKKPPKSESSNLAFIPKATNLQESTKSAQTKTKSKTVDEIAAEGSLNRKQQLTSEYKEEKKPPKSESSNLGFIPKATNLQESTKSAQTKTKSKTVDEIAAEGSLNRKQQLTSEYKEEKKPPKSESSNLAFIPKATNLQESTKSAQTKTKSKTVDEIAAEGSLNRKQQLTSEYKEEKKPPKSESSNLAFIPKATNLQESTKSAQTKTKSKTVDEIAAEGSLNRKQQLTSEYKEEKKPPKSESSNLAFIPKATNLQESTKSAQTKTKSKTVDEIAAEGSLNRKQQLTSEYKEEKKPPKSESSNLAFIPKATNLQESTKSAQTKTKSKTVDEIAAEGSLNRKQQLTSEYKEEKKPPKSESSNLAFIPKATNLQESTKSAQTKTKSKTVDEIAAEGSLNRKQQLTSEYKEEKKPPKSESSNLAFIPKATNLQESTKSAQTKTKSKTVDEIAAEGSLNRKQQLTSEYKEEKKPPKSESSNLAFIPKATNLQESTKSAQTKTKSKTVDEIAAEGSLNRKQQLTSEYKEEKKPPKSESSNLAFIPKATNLQESTKSAQTKTKSKTVDEIAAEGSLNRKQQLTSEYKEEKKPPKSESSNLAFIPKATNLQESTKSAQTKTKSKTVDEIAAEGSLNRKQQLTSEYKEEKKPPKSESSNLATDLQESPKSPQTKMKSKTVGEISAEGSLNRKQQLTSQYEQRRTQTLESSLLVEDISEEVSLCSKRQLTSEYQERRRPHTSESTHRVIDLRHTQKQAWTETTSNTVDEIPEKDSLSRLSKKSGIDDAWPISHNEDFKDKVISKTCILTAKTSENQRKQIHFPPLHLEKMSQESEMNRACDKEDTSVYSGHPSVQKEEEIGIKQGTLEQRKNLQLSKDESKQKSPEFSVKFKMTECPEEEPLRDNSKEGTSLRQMPSNLTSKMLDCEGKDAFGKSVSAALETFPEGEETSLKIVPPSHADPGSPADSPSSSSAELRLREKELHSENDHKSDVEYVLNKNEIFYNDTENKKEKHAVVTSEVREDQEFAMQMTKNMNPNTRDWKLGIRPTPQSSDPKGHFDLWFVRCNETKPMIQLKSHDMSADTNTYKEIKPDQDLFQKPLCADHCSANYCKSMDSKLKDESSSALHNDRTPGVYVNEELQKVKNKVDILKAEHLAWKREKIQLQKEVKEKKGQKSSKREVSRNMDDGADKDSGSIGLSQQSNKEHTDNQQPSDKINENTGIFMNKVEEKEQKSSKREVSGNMDDGADDDRDSIGLNQQSNSEQSDEMSENTVISVKKVEEKKEQKSSKKEASGNMDEGADDSGSGGLSQQNNSEQTDKQQVSIVENEESHRLCSNPGIGDSRPISHNEDLKDKVISETHTPTAKTSKNQSKHICLPPLHLEKMTQESQINRACDKEDTSAYSGHPSVQRKTEMCIKQGTLEQRKNLQLSKDESHEFSVKFKMTECPEEEPLRDNSKEGASLRQMPSNLTGKVLDCEGKDAFGKSVSAALQTFPEGEETSLKIVSPSHADPGSPEDSPSSSSSELCLRERKLHSGNDHKPDAEHVLNKNEESFYNDTENKKERHPVVTSEVREDQDFAMQMTKNMNPNTTDWKLGIRPTPQSRDPKSHLELQHPCCNETKLITEVKSHDMPAVTNAYKETKPNQDVFQKPLCADHFRANYCKSMDSKLKDESSSAPHNDRTPGVYVNEKLQRIMNEVDMYKAEHLALKRKKIQIPKEAEEEKKKQKSSERKVSGNIYNAAADDSDGRSQKNKVEQTDKQQLPVMGSEDSDRSTLREEKEKRRKADLLCEKNRVQLRKKEEHSIKEVKMNSQLETNIRTQAITLEIIGENKVVEEQNYTQRQPSAEQNARILQDGILTEHFCKPKVIEIAHKKMNSEVSENSDEEKSRLHENRMLWDAIAKLRREMNTVKNQVQEMGKNCFEEIAIVQEKTDRLEKALRKTVFQHNVELEVLRAENTVLNSKLEDEQQNRGRLEAEVESYRSRLATAVQDHEHCQTAKGDLQLTFQRARYEWFCLWDKMNSDMSNLKHNNEILSQQLSKMETKINSLEIELHHKRDALNERTLVLERGLIQKQCQKEETEHVYQKEQGKIDKDIGKQESLQERLFHLQSENMLLRQQLYQAHNKVDREEKTVINIQDQILNIIKIFDDETENYNLMLNKIIKELINEWHHFKERIHQCENDHVERDAIVKQFQQELADTKTKLSTIEFFLEIESRHHMHLEDKKQDFKNKLDQSRSQNDELISKLQPSSSKCIRLDEEKTPQQELSMEALLKRREELKAEKEKWKERAENLVTQMNMHMEEDCVGEKYNLKFEEITKEGSEAASRGQH